MTPRPLLSLLLVALFALSCPPAAAGPVDPVSSAGAPTLSAEPPAKPGTDAGTDAATPADDLALSRDVARRLHAVDGLRDVSVTARGGVVQLEGEVVEADDRALAEQLASQQAGVTSVENRVELDTRLSVRMQAALRQATDKLLRLVAAAPLLLVAILVLALAWRIGRWLGGRVGRRHWRGENPYTASLVQRLVQWGVMLAGLILALDLLGATALVGAVVGSAGVVGLVVGFAFKDIAENYVAGILLSLRRPFAPGDHLRIDGTYEGKVAALTSRATILVTLDGNRLTLPNALVFKSVTLNFSGNPVRRFDFAVPIDLAQSIRAAQQIAMEQITATDGVLADPGPSWSARGYEEGGIVLQFFGWVDQRASDLGKVRSEAIHAVRTAFEEHGIEAPRTVRYIARLAPEAQPPVPPPLPVDTAPADTSVNRELDAQVEAVQRAHSDEDLIGAQP